MYSANQVINGLKDPRGAFHYFKNKIYDSYFNNLRNHTGVAFMEKDWDNLIILDACRFDLFSEVNTPTGDLSAVQSSASETETFLKNELDGRVFDDVVYITANPQITKIDASFHDIHYLWESHWNDEYGTVMPSDMAEYSLNMESEYPHKRLLVHFIQPHIPFIGETGQSISQDQFRGGTLDPEEKSMKSVWDLLRDGDISSERAWKAYRENLEVALSEIQPLIDALDGKTIISSDHGNAFGEWEIYGHPKHRYIDPITTVPWLELPFENRKEITSEEVTESIDGKETYSVTAQLEDLGYV